MFTMLPLRLDVIAKRQLIEQEHLLGKEGPASVLAR